jgi:hypothetical protein
VTELKVVVPDEVAERLASEAAARGRTTEQLAAEVLALHAPAPARGRLAFIGLFDPPVAVGAAEMERRLEDGELEGFGR